MRVGHTGLTAMLPDEQQIVRILAESGEPMYPSQIAESLNTELVSGTDYEAGEVIKHLQSLGEHVIQVSDGRWTLRRLLG
jgi:repressor of nif and glnA expression